MYRSIVLILGFLFFSVALPCVCEGGAVSLLMEESCLGISSSHDHDGSDHDAMTMKMNPLDHIASWRAFLSSSLPAAFFLLALLLISVFGRKKWRICIAGLFGSRSEIFRPPDRFFNERIILFSPLRRALYTGVLHAKISC